MDFQAVAELVGTGVEAAGVVVMVAGILVATVIAVTALARGRDGVYRAYRRQIGRSILLGLEFLVAGDIIRTVAIEPTFRSLGILAVIVAIRTFLSTELELEIEGRWPWQRREQPATAPGGATEPVGGGPVGDAAARGIGARQ